MRRQGRKKAVRLQKMTRNRFRIQQFPLTPRSPLHANIVVNNDQRGATATPNYSEHS